MIKTTTLLCLLTLSAAWAGQISTAIGSGFANACAGTQYFGGLPNPGDGFSTTTDTFMTCQTTTGSPASAANSGAHNTDSATAQAGVGFIKVGASNSTNGGVAFAGAAAYGGWNDQMTIGGGTGNAVWIAAFTLTGDIDATGPRGLSRVGVAAYENHNFLQPYGAAINGFAYNEFTSLNGGNVNGGIRNSVILFGWDYQGVWYGADESLNSYALNRTVYFALPFTYGTPFEFGVYSGGVVGVGSSGAVGTSSFDLTHTLTWAGTSYVIDQNNQTNPNFTLASQSGFNYSQPFNAPAPEPATAGSLLLALGAVACLKRRMVRRSDR